VRYPLLRLLAVVMVAAVLVYGCGKKTDTNAAADSTATDSTSLANAKGSMEGDGENFGKTDGASAASDTSSGNKSRKERSVSVNVSRAVRADLIRPVVAEGKIRARHSAELHSEVVGRAARLAAEEGQTVRRGQLIVKLDDREYEMAAEEARARYLQSLSLLTIEDADIDTAMVTQAKEMRDQLTDLEKQEKSGKISRDERLAREIALDVQALKDGKFRGEVAAARSGVAVARADHERARV
jgi:multidrug efflux pump subunit AcrA (membrane-fusion protein)